MLAWSECYSMQAATWKCRTKKADGLMLAARAGSLEVAELLVRHGANVNAREKMARSDGTDVGGAARSAELTRFLIAHKADVDAGRWRTTGRAR